MNQQPDNIQWAPRVALAKIRGVYVSERDGRLDEDLLEAVGYALLARCSDILAVTAALAGRVECRRCGQVILRQRVGQLDEHLEQLRCGACGWEVAWGDYFHSISGRKLRGSEVVHEYQQFVDDWQQARTAPAKMLAIDRLIHAFHTYQGRPGKSVAVTVIGGSSGQVMEFIEGLAK
jgi:hypothetical protein